MKTELIKAYLETADLRELGLPLPVEKKEQIAQLEKQWVNKDLLPYIQAMLTPLLEDFQSELNLEISYSPTQGVKVTRGERLRPESENSTTKIETTPVPRPTPSLSPRPVTGALSSTSIPREAGSSENKKRYYLIGQGGQTQVTCHQEGTLFILHEGSFITDRVSASYKNPENRRSWLRAHAENLNNGSWRVKHDVVFNSASTLATVCLGMSANGTIALKDTQGRTLKENMNQ